MRNINDLQNTALLSQIKELIVQSRQQLAVSVNSALSLLYWQIGKRINEEILINTRADYGQQIMESLSTQLTLEYGKGWSKRQLHHCVRFAEIFPDINIVHTLCARLSWSHIRLITPMEDELRRMFCIGK